MILRDYQKTAINAGFRYFKREQDKPGALMVLPTGAGKSLVIAGIAAQMEDPTLVFQPTKEILEQNLAKMHHYEEYPAVYSASMNSKKVGRLTFATIGSVKNHPEFFLHFRHVIVDECHYVNAKNGMYRDFFAYLPDDTRVLGLTATPYRLVTFGFGCAMLKFLTRTRPRVFHKVIHVTQNADLFDRGYLAKLRYTSENDIFDSNKLTQNTTGADYTDRSIKRYYEEIDFVGSLTEQVQLLLSVRRNVLVFTRFIDESQALVDDLGSRAEIVSSETPKRERARIIKGFKSGNIKVVSNVGVLTHGFDFPELETVVLARPTMSLALYYQMIGRGIRIHPHKPSTLVVDLCDNYSKFGRIEDLTLTSSKPGLWYIESRGRQLTNVYYGDRR